MKSRDFRPTATGWRRLAAFGVDYLVIAAYIGVLTGVGIVVQRALGLGFEPPRTLRGRLLGEAVGMLTLTLPVAGYFALTEASPWQATIGKRALGLRVATAAGQRLPLGRAVLRSLLKFAPWELAHASLWHTPGWPTQPQPGPITYAGSALALLLAGWYVLSIFVGARRTPYDRAADTRVLVAAST
ncbi:MAG: RDD family protein [Chloroflexota bacterium]